MEVDIQRCQASTRMLQPHGPHPPQSLSSPPRPPSPPHSPQSSPIPSDFDQDDPDVNSRPTTPLGCNYPPTSIQKFRTAIDFIKMVRGATLASQFEPDELAEFLHPQEIPSSPPEDPSLKLSLLNFISFMGCSQNTYEAARQNTQQCYPGIKLLSYYQAERRAKLLSGVVTWEHHMCV